MHTLISFFPFQRIEGEEELYPRSILGTKAKIFQTDDGYEVHVVLADDRVADTGVHRPCETYEEAVALADGVIRGMSLGYLAGALQWEEDGGQLDNNEEETETNSPYAS